MINRLLVMLVKYVDTYLFTVVCILLVIGLMVLYSASGGNFGMVGYQSLKICAAFGAMWLAANVPLHWIARLALPVYLIGLGLLICVPLFGVSAHGAQRWLNLGFMRVQPSEVMKIAVPLVLAWYFDRYEAILRFQNFVVGAVAVIVPVYLVAKQPDLGTALLIAAAGFYVIFLAGLNWRVLAGALVIVGASAPLLWPFLHSYQKKRILTLIDPSSDPLGAGYHTIQSTIAIGSGGFFGKGWLNGTQAHLDFLPERTTDFIFAVFAEEWGLLGNMVLVTLFLLIIGRGMMIASNAPTLFTRLLAGAITMTFFTYVFVNMGMVAGILPVVGVPLPLISFGGTSMVTIMFGIGLLMSIHTHKRLVQS